MTDSKLHAPAPDSTDAAILLKKLEAGERHAVERAAFLTMIPIIVTVALIGVSAYVVLHAQTELKETESQLEKANKEVERLTKEKEARQKELQLIAVQLDEAVSAAKEIDAFLRKISPPKRSQYEAGLFISLQKLFDRLHDASTHLAEEVPQLSNVRSDLVYVTVVKSADSPQALQAAAQEWSAKVGHEKIAIYKSSNNVYALAILGDGTYTKAYDLAIQLRRDTSAPDAYQAGQKDWGENYYH